MMREAAAAKPPSVSVIIIFLNPGGFLEEAIESVFAQTSGDWELLLCDDGSTDEGTDIARHAAEQHPDRVRYLEHEGHENRGMSATRNLGLSHARGKYVSWLDADDAWKPTKVADQIELLESNPEAAMVFGPAELWYGWTGRPDDFRKDFIQDVGLEPDRMLEPPELIENFLLSDMHFCTGVMVKREVLSEIGNYEEDFKGDYEDIIVHCKLALRYPVYFSSKTWYRYRQHHSQYSEGLRRSRGERMTRRAFYERLIQHMLQHGLEAEFPDLLANVRRRHRDNNRHWKHLPLEFARRWSWRVAEGLRATLRNSRKVMDRLLPGRLRETIGWLWYGRRGTPMSGWVHFGSLRRTSPLGRQFGWDRGGPIDRHYIERFLEEHQNDIAGEVMEVGEALYTNRYGGERVTHAHVLHAVKGNPEASFVADLSTGEGMPESKFDCIVLTQVLPFVWDFEKAIESLYRALKPGGVLLVTVPGISQISRYDADRWGDFWRFTSQSAGRLFAGQFGEGHVTVQAHGNVLSAISMLMGMGRNELRAEELDVQDPDYEMIITVRAIRPADEA